MNNMSCRRDLIRKKSVESGVKHHSVNQPKFVSELSGCMWSARIIVTAIKIKL